MTDTFRALCAELVELDQAEPGDYANWRQNWNAAIARARAELAKPEPQGPTDEELQQIWRFGYAKTDWHRFRDIARSVLARYGRPAIEPTDEELADAFSQGCRDISSSGESPFLGGARAVWNLARR